MKFRYCMLLVLFFIPAKNMRSQEYLYPVASFTDAQGRTQVYLVYQKSLHHMELWLWDPQSTHACKALLSSFIPAGLRMLPDCSGFSFIDDGRVRVKMHSKRSPKVLDLYEPIYDLGIIEWFDSQRGYFSAKEQENFGIFHLTMQADVTRLVAGQNKDCMYPQKVANTLFYVERLRQSETNHQYAIIQAPYPEISYQPHDFNDTERLEQRVEELLKNDDQIQKRKPCIDNAAKTVIADFGTRAIAFLHMISEGEGFVVEHPTHISRGTSVVPFSYNQMKKNDNGTWRVEPLFSFSVPADLIVATGDACNYLYESMLPLLPRYCDGTIYFVDCSTSESRVLNLFSYQIDPGATKQHTFNTKPGTHLFVPLAATEKRLFCGGAVQNESSPSLGLDEEGICCSLVQI